MKLFKSYTYSWWQIGIFKVALLAIGAAAGAYWHEFFSQYFTLLVIITVIASAYVMSVSLRQ